jgi:hypothetical protein
MREGDLGARGAWRGLKGLCGLAMSVSASTERPFMRLRDPLVRCVLRVRRPLQDDTDTQPVKIPPSGFIAACVFASSDDRERRLGL